MEHTRTIKNSKSNIFFVCVDFRPRNNIKSTGIYKKSKARLDTNLYSAVGASGSHPVFPGINSRARKPEIDWLLYAATGYLALEIIHLFSYVLFKENGTNHSDNPSTIITTESPPPTTRHCRRMKKYPAGKISGILINPIPPNKIPESQCLPCLNSQSTMRRINMTICVTFPNQIL